MKRFLAFSLFFCLLTSALTGCGSKSASVRSLTDLSEYEQSLLDSEYAVGSHHVQIEVENYGIIQLELDGDTAPLTTANFCALAEAGFYDGLTFHRIIDGFMIQGGDPLGDGTGGSENTITGEFSNNEIDNDISHVRGVISMARSSEYNSASSQFFITQADCTYLDGDYAAFGTVTDGMDVVDAIAEGVTVQDSNGTVDTADQPVITSVTVLD